MKCKGKKGWHGIVEACRYCIVPKLNDIKILFMPSNKYSIHPSNDLQVSDMSFSGSSTLPARRKRTVSERVIENGDPLVIKKKAREAAEQASSLAPSTTKKTTQVCFFSFKKIISPSFWPLLTMYCI